MILMQVCWKIKRLYILLRILVNKVQMARLHPSLYFHQPLCLSATSLHFKEALTALLISTFGPFLPTQRHSYTSINSCLLPTYVACQTVDVFFLWNSVVQIYQLNQRGHSLSICLFQHRMEDKVKSRFIFEFRFVNVYFFVLEILNLDYFSTFTTFIEHQFKCACGSFQIQKNGKCKLYSFLLHFPLFTVK